MTHRIARLVLLVPFLGVGACTDDTPAQTRERLGAIAPGLVQDVSDAAGGAKAGDSVSSYQRSMAQLNTTFVGLPFQLPFAATAAAKVVTAAGATSTGTSSSGPDLGEILFSDDAYEGFGVFRLRGEKVCDGDPDCIAKVNAAEIRVKVALLDDGGIRFILLIGPQRAAPLVLTLHPNAAELSVDLGQLKSAIETLAAVAGKTVNLPDVMEGEIHASLTRNAPKDITLAGGIGRDVRIEAAIPEGPISLRLAASDPVIRIHLDGNTRTLDGALALGEVQLAAPWKALKSTSLATGQLSVDLKGLTASATVSASDPALRVTGIGMGAGTSTLKLGDVTIVAVDLNPSDGRRFDLEVAPVAGELPTFAFTPALRGAVRVFFQPFAQAGDSVPAYLMDETYTFDMGRLLQPYTGGIRVLQGPLTLSATKAGASVTVPTGQCLVSDPLTAGEQPVIGVLAAAPCP